MRYPEKNSYKSNPFLEEHPTCVRHIRRADKYNLPNIDTHLTVDASVLRVLSVKSPFLAREVGDCAFVFQDASVDPVKTQVYTKHEYIEPRECRLCSNVKNHNARVENIGSGIT